MNGSNDFNGIDVDQLIKVGVFLIVGGCIGSFYAETTCHFVSVQKSIGYYSQTFHLHAGMYEYTSLDSAFSGHAFCLPYDEYYSSAEPIIPRIGGAVALVTGGLVTLVLWFYLIFMMTNRFFWGFGIFSAWTAAISQLATFYFFFDDVCQDEICTIGPGSFMAVVAFVSYVLTARTMYRNYPGQNASIKIEDDDDDTDTSSYTAPTLV